MTDDTSLGEALSALFAAEREARRWHDDITSRADGDRKGVLDAIREAVARGLAEDDEEEATSQLVPLARLLGELEGSDVADSLVDVLRSEHPEARREAGEHLQGLALDHFAEVSDAVGRALDRLAPDSPALVELPFVLVDVPDPGVVPLLARFLERDDPDVVAAAIESLAEVGDPAAIGPLRKLIDDPRIASLADDDDDGSGVEVSVGDLAVDAVRLLGEGL
ncbi:MAG: HEAT repeat domain-containing protein [Myxococcota bacterium]